MGAIYGNEIVEIVYAIKFQKKTHISNNAVRNSGNFS